MKKFLILALVLNLGACAQVQKFKDEIVATVTPTNINKVQDAYGAALALAVGYRDLCQRKVIDKSCWNVIAMLQPYENKAYNAVTAARNFVTANPNLDATSLLNAALSEISALRTAEANNGVQ